MTGLAVFSMPGLVAGLALAGFVFGLGYFAAMRWTAGLFAARRGWLFPLALTLGRIGAAVALFVLAAKMGTAPLLAAFAGFLVARAAALRAVRRAS